MRLFAVTLTVVLPLWLLAMSGLASMTGTAAASERGERIVRSDYDVYLRNRQVVFVNRECGPDDTAGRFFLHIYPVDTRDLPAGRRQHGFANVDFRFQNAHGEGITISRVGRSCLIKLPLPDYAIAALRVGQYISGQGRLWEGEHRLAAADVRKEPAGGAADPPRPPNIVFIMADDLGKGLLPVYGAQVDIATPNIDRLAREGVVFDNAWATPVCLATRAMLLTGRYPINNGIAGHADPTEVDAGVFLDPRYQPSFALPLQETGYATAIAGKWDGRTRHQSEFVYRAFGFDRWMLAANHNAREVLIPEGTLYLAPEEFVPDLLADFAVDFIAENRDRPFFLYYPMNLVHRPLAAMPGQVLAAARPSARDAEKLIGMTEYADRMIGRVLDALEANGVRDNTIVFFSGDNGVAIDKLFDGEGKAIVARGKNMLTERGINVPLIVSGGPVIRRGRTDALTDFTDMLPTLAALAGAPVPDDWALDGHSIADFLLGRAEDTPRAWIASMASVHPFIGTGGREMRSACGRTCNRHPVQRADGTWFWRAEYIGVVVRDRRFKLWHHGNGFRALFDLQNDPAESVNLWNSEDPIVAAAKRKLLRARHTLPPDGDVHVAASPLTSDYGLYAHWRLDRPLPRDEGPPVFPDRVGGYPAWAGATARTVSGKLGNAVHAASLAVANFGIRLNPQVSLLPRFTVSAWVLLNERQTDEANLIRLRRMRDEKHSLIALVAKADGSLAARHWLQEMSTSRRSLPRGRWVHVALTWGPVGDGLETLTRGTVLYIDGKARARTAEFFLLPHKNLPNSVRLEIGGAGVVVDDVAVWRHALKPEQVVALHDLGERQGLDAEEISTLFDASFDLPRAVQVGGREWQRMATPVDSDGLDGLTVVETPEGVMEIHFGHGISVRSTPPADGKDIAPHTGRGGGSAADPFPASLSAQPSVNVNIAEFASLPDSEGRPAAMMLLVDEPGTRRLFVNDMRGTLYSVSYDGRITLPYLDLKLPRWELDLYTEGSRGFQSFAFHPQFNSAGTPGFGKFYTLSDTGIPHQSDLGAGDSKPDVVLLEWSAQHPAAKRYDGGAPREMLRMSGTIDVMLAFNPLPQLGDPDYGMLYVAVSDPYGQSQRLDSIFGKILRIDPSAADSANGEYGIPTDNPFAGDGDPGTLDEIYAYGMRVPQRIAWDADNGSLFVADIGSDGVEEISIVTAGANLGWNDWEGSFKTIKQGGPPFITLDNPRSDPAITYPVVEYDHVDDLLLDSVAITGIVVYRDNAIPQLEDLLLFGDIVSGETFSIHADMLHNDGPAIRRVLFIHEGQTKTLLDLIQEKNREQKAGRGVAHRADLRFGTGPDGMLFLLNKRDGIIRRLTGVAP